ncbi:lytic murein transglycosylase B [Marinobacterium sediminicola]|uniref:Membrane-bound lytic murein transglycosylase B n=1 Tax=Marinobacterium sediminicola TaxID=518898 RepID=A0ABY1S0J9_9GAMM|nr:lytic murein transglycosylase B [Marinobacterium sediminicola]ULG69627.1 lytic murein transglycosylase B [Marinobacterium sediminicola]SMR74645.1 membrane-bound lytic murein transglycosylase B [Marinobacterium sediminicola]
MRKTLGRLLLASTLLTTGSVWASSGYENHPLAGEVVEQLAAEGFDAEEVRSVLAKAKRQESILEAISRPAERRLTWGEYRKIFVEPRRIKQGVAFWNEHEATLKRAEETYGVPAEIIVSIIGVETRYGRIMGRYRVLDALATLGFDYPKRADFFRGQLVDFMRMAREEQLDPTQPLGSYAGAMGYGQFIPSSFRNYAVDFDGDGKRDIWSNEVDAIGSVANYFREHGWKAGEPVRSNVVINGSADPSWFNAGLKPELTLAQWHERGIATRRDLDPQQPATLMELTMEDGEHYWFGLHNFYVITRYNHSRLYAMAVYELSQAIKDARQPETAQES